MADKQQIRIKLEVKLVLKNNLVDFVKRKKNNYQHHLYNFLGKRFQEKYLEKNP